MAKSSKERHMPVEVQRGPIRMDQQYTYKFTREPEKVMRDIQESQMRRYGQTMEFQQPKQ